LCIITKIFRLIANEAPLVDEENDVAKPLKKLVGRIRWRRRCQGERL
jgi:hypothetical protein